MKRQTVIASLLLLLLTLLCLSGPALAAGEEKITASGKVIPLAYDENDKVVVVSIEGADGSYYDVAPEGKGKELLNHAEKNVEAVGHLLKDEDGYEMLMVESYKLLD